MIFTMIPRFITPVPRREKTNVYTVNCFRPEVTMKTLVQVITAPLWCLVEIITAASLCHHAERLRRRLEER